MAENERDETDEEPKKVEERPITSAEYINLLSQHAEAGNALVAAVRMQQQVARLGAERVQRGLAPLRIGIGLHHGPAVVGNIGSDERMQYTAIGDTVNIAARLVGRAEPGQILISETMHSAAGGGDLFHDLGLISVKGRDAQVRVYSVDWEKIVQRAPAA